MTTRLLAIMLFCMTFGLGLAALEPSEAAAQSPGNTRQMWKGANCVPALLYWNNAATTHYIMYDSSGHVFMSDTDARDFVCPLGVYDPGGWTTADNFWVTIDPADAGQDDVTCRVCSNTSTGFTTYCGTASTWTAGGTVGMEELAVNTYQYDYWYLVCDLDYGSAIRNYGFDDN